jgi:molybdenum cofactor synthesis domain-containing protein
MPREGVFARVLCGGDIKIGDEMTIEARENPRPFQAAVITLSDRCSRGERTDTAGPAITNRLTEAGYEIAEAVLIPDDGALLQRHLVRLADQRQLDLILTTGGTGFAARDVTPEATLAVATRNAPGIAEAMRAHSLAITPRAMLSRGVSVIRNATLIVNLPGSPKACGECLDCILDSLPHAISLLRGSVTDCAVP